MESESGLSVSTVKRLRAGQDASVEQIVAISVALHLPPPVSGDLLRMCGITLDFNNQKNTVYQMILTEYYKEGIQQMEPIRRSTAVYAPPEVVDGKPPVYPYTPIKSSFENAGSIEEMMLYTELQSAVHAMIQRLEYSFTFNPSLLTSPKRKQQVAEILEEAEKYIWRIKGLKICSDINFK